MNLPHFNALFIQHRNFSTSIRERIVFSFFCLKLFLLSKCYLLDFFVYLLYNMKAKEKGDNVTNIEIDERERIDDLQLKGLKIIQNKDGFCYGVDSVLLSDFTKEIKENSRVLDLGAGNGIIGLLLCGKTKLKTMIGIEIQPQVCEMATRSILYNQLQDRFQIIQGDIKKIEELIPTESFDVVVTNPPYKRENSGIQNNSRTKLIARHEILCNLEDIVKASFFALKEKGSLYLVHRPERLVDILFNLRKYDIEPKIIRFVHPKQGKKPILVLIKAVKHGNPFLQIKEPLIMYNENGFYTEEINTIYGR